VDLPFVGPVRGKKGSNLEGGAFAVKRYGSGQGNDQRFKDDMILLTGGALPVRLKGKLPSKSLTMQEGREAS